MPLLRYLGSAEVGSDLKATCQEQLDSCVYCLVCHYAWCKMAFFCVALYFYKGFLNSGHWSKVGT